jgi:hypothetical protein
MNPRSFNHPDDFAKAFAIAHPGFFPTYFSSLQIDWSIERETEKAVKTVSDLWVPKSQIIVEDGRVVGIKKSFYQKLIFSASRRAGF